MRTVFWYFGYGSNMALRSLLAKGVIPHRSERGILRGWRLRFNVQHFFRHEGGVANIEPSNDPSDEVWGVLHWCEDKHLVLLDTAEVYPHGYDRIMVTVRADHGEQQAIAYVGTSSFLNEASRPSRRYLSFLLEGAAAADIDPSYIEMLRRHPVHQKPQLAKFAPPSGEYPIFTAQTLPRHPLYTALAGSVFDMSCARWHHRFLHDIFGGKDTTLFHLMRLDGSNGSETLDDIKHARLSSAQQQRLNEYLDAYASEYEYVGKFRYD
jgi:sulfite reductase (NADPH) flavoprotein alpha-component